MTPWNVAVLATCTILAVYWSIEVCLLLARRPLLAERWSKRRRA
jgi:hypothetical protein